MAIIEREATKELRVVAAHCRIGRAPGNELVVDARSVSNEQASLRWKASGWELCDLGSRNGTFVGGRVLEPGSRVTVSEGQVLAFGDPDEAWRLVDAGAPGLLAVCQNTGRVVRAEAEFLALPSAETAEVTVYEGADEEWFVERPEGTAPLPRSAMVAAGGTLWHVGLPAPALETTAFVAAKWLSLAEVRLRFAVTRDEEHVELTLFAGDRPVAEFGARAHHHTLLVLARERTRDAAARADRRPTEHGWVDREDLLRMLGLNEWQFNLHVFKLREAFKGAKVRDGFSIVERRATGERRIGTDRVEETRI